MSNLSSYNLTEEEKDLLIIIINNFGTDQHPIADNNTLEFFIDDYIKEILQSKEFKNSFNNLTAKGIRIVKSLEKKFLK